MATRTLILVRHGQYKRTAKGALTALGREQARRTGRALRREPIDAVYSSTMLRAEQTAAIMCAVLGDRTFSSSRLLREGMPTRGSNADVSAARIDADRARADRAYERWFKPSRSDRTDVLVCHGNLIRYLMCRVLCVPPHAWIRFHTNNCGISRVLIDDDGARWVASYSETMHLPHALVTAT